MSIMFAGYYIAVFLYIQTSSGQARLAPPHNVTVISLNTRYELSWAWDQSAAGTLPVSFTTQFLPKYKLRKRKQDWSEVCETPHTSCDLTPLDIHYQGIYLFRVRASAGHLQSDWVQEEFCPDKQAALGPPSRVDVTPAGSVLDVSISDPLASNNRSMREHVPTLLYRIVYWKRSSDRKVLKPLVLSSSTNLVTLSDLSPQTWYCVSVQTRYDFYNKSSSFTSPHCAQTEGATPWWQIVLYFTAALLIAFVVVLPLGFFSIRGFKILKATFFPSVPLPESIHQYFCDSSPGSDRPRLLSPESEAELICDRVSICPEAVLLEIHTPPPEVGPPPPPGSEQDSSGRHSRQGSGDSGVYSTEGGSLQKPPDSGQPPTAPGPLEQLSMEIMDAKLQGESLGMDEGVGDVSV